MLYSPGSIVVRTTYESDGSGIQVGDILKIKSVIRNNTILVVYPIKTADKSLEGLTLFINIDTVAPKIILKRKTHVI